MSVSSSNPLNVWLVVIVAIVGFSIPTAASAEIVRLLTVGDVYSRAKDPDVDWYSVFDYVEPEAFPYVGSTTAEIGNARFEATYDFLDDGLFVTFDHDRSAARGSSGNREAGSRSSSTSPSTTRPMACMTRTIQRRVSRFWNSHSSM